MTADGATWASTPDAAFARAMMRDAAMAPDGRVIAVGNKYVVGEVVWVGEPMLRHV